MAKAPAKRATKSDMIEPESFNELVAKSIASITQGMTVSSDSIEMLTQKVTSMACHIVALESLLTEVISITGVDLVRVNQRIRTRVTVKGESLNDSETVVDLAAAIASPSRR